MDREEIEQKLHTANLQFDLRCERLKRIYLLLDAPKELLEGEFRLIREAGNDIATYTKMLNQLNKNK